MSNHVDIKLIYVLVIRNTSKSCEKVAHKFVVRITNKKVSTFEKKTVANKKKNTARIIHCFPKYQAETFNN